MSPRTLRAADNGTTQKLANGERFVIRLAENPTTGFRWSVEPSEFVELERDDYVPGDPGIGAGGERVLFLRAKKAGSGQLRLKLRRGWEGESSAVQRFEIRVDIT